jgi:hydrogenase maturation protease
MASREGRTVVLGLGNLLMADDRAGLAALERLRDEWFVPHDVELVDGGTWGMNLLPLVEGAERLLVLDAVDAQVPAGTVVELHNDEVPAFLACKLSPHQVDLADVLALARLRGSLPNEMVLVGVQPGRIEMSAEMTPVVEGSVQAMVERAVHWLDAWGKGCRRREAVHA